MFFACPESPTACIPMQYTMLNIHHSESNDK